MNEKVLLTIAVPTYNRAQYLDRCLSQICKQMSGQGTLLELLVSDNHSTDDTPRIVQNHIDQGSVIRYIRNEANIGPDRNFIQCFEQARGKYLLILGDDDILLGGALDKIVKLLQDDEYGVVHLRPYGFSTDFNAEKPRQTARQSRTVIYDNANDFVGAVSYWFTFISGNIINKGSIEGSVDLERFLDTNLIQLSWTFPALLKAKKNAVVHEYLIAGQNDNNGGYQFFKVFCVNLNKIMSVFFKEGLSKTAISRVNRSLIKQFFPFYTLKLRDPSNRFEREDFLPKLNAVYQGDLLFWLYLYPLIKLPLPLAKMWILLIRISNKLERSVSRN